MSMIDGISGRPAGLNGPSVRLDPATQQAAVEKPRKTEVASEAPRAELSSLATAARDAASAPIDEARVAQLREAIANGTYSIDPERIASKMVELDLGWTADN